MERMGNREYVVLMAFKKWLMVICHKSVKVVQITDIIYFHILLRGRYLRNVLFFTSSQAVSWGPWLHSTLPLTWESRTGVMNLASQRGAVTEQGEQNSWLMSLMMARVSCWTSDFGSGHDLMVLEFKSCIRLSAVSTEPALDPLSASLCAPSPLMHAFSLYQK